MGARDAARCMDEVYCQMPACLCCMQLLQRQLAEARQQGGLWVRVMLLAAWTKYIVRCLPVCAVCSCCNGSWLRPGSRRNCGCA